MLSLRDYPFELRFKYPFALAAGMRESTPVVYVELEYEGLTGYGEAALPGYLPETQQSVIAFISRLKFKQFVDPVHTDSIVDYIFSSAPKNFSAKAAVDMALHDLAGKILNKPCHVMLELDKNNCPETTFTIGMDVPEIILKKLEEAKDFNLLKVKLGGTTDKLIIETIRTVTDKPICVDANQGWKEKEYALEMIHWLNEHGVILIEQPLDKNKLDDALWLKEKSPLPVIADEAVQTVDDIKNIKDAYHGINIKLMKCGGMREAIKMIKQARKLNLKVMLGCMSESSCGVSAAAQLTPLVDWADLDGPLLITNDIFEGVTYNDGKIILSDLPGTGAVKK
ncbi:MAG: dipeptide epimerase [Bacteroidia bacterium]|nr:dipeptide epimerase [Bacteroidia bacterium]